MVVLWLVIAGWVYAVLTALCFRKLRRRFQNWSKGGLIAASVAWPLWILFWALNHSVTKSVDWIEKLLDSGFPTSKDRSNRNLDVKNIPD